MTNQEPTRKSKIFSSIFRRRSKILLAKLEQVESPDTTYQSENFPIVMKKAAGLYIRDVDGNRFIDMTACFGVLALGHRPKTTLTAIRKQSAKMIHGMGDVHPSDAKIRFLELLAQLLPYEKPRCILGQSGADAIEAAMKTAIRVTGKKRFLVFEGSYHGLHFGALQLTSREHFREGIESWNSPHVTVVPFPLTINPDMICGEKLALQEYLEGDHQADNLINDNPIEDKCASEKIALEKIENELAKGDVAAVFCEPIQGRAGERTFPTGFLQKVQKLCKEAQTLLVFDEIYTGFGRTGKFFGCEWHGLVPDLMCLGKAIGGGMPLSVCAGNIVSQWPRSEGEARHTSTFLGHPLACATGHATLKELRRCYPDLLTNLEKIDLLFTEFLGTMRSANLPRELSFEIRGTGWMRGFWFFQAKPGFAVKLSEDLLARGYITLPSGPKGRVLSWTPPLIIDEKTVKTFLKVLADQLISYSERRDF